MRCTHSTFASLVVVVALGGAACDTGSPEPTPEPAPPTEPDPLGLNACDDDVPSALEGVELPALNRLSEADADVFCPLRALDDLTGSADVVCLGEGSHGVSESTAWYRALLRYLVFAQGHRTVVLEATNAAMLHVEEYVRTGDTGARNFAFTDMANSLADSREWEGLYDELRAIQEELGDDDPLSVRGFDVAVQPALTQLAVVEYLDVVAPDDTATWAARLPSRLTNGLDFTEAGNAAQELADWLDENRDELIAIVDEDAWITAHVNAQNLRDGYRFLGFYFGGDFVTGDATFREPGMVRNLRRQRERAPDGKLAILAHNVHCASDTFIGNDIDGVASPAFGTALDEELGDAYRVIAQGYLDGFEMQLGGQVVSALASNGSVELALAIETTADVLLVDTRGDVIDFERSLDMNRRGAIIPSAQYDGILWIRNVGAIELR